MKIHLSICHFFVCLVYVSGGTACSDSSATNQENLSYKGGLSDGTNDTAKRPSLQPLAAVDSGAGFSDKPSCVSAIPVRIRDFKSEHPDFEQYGDGPGLIPFAMAPSGLDLNIVEAQLDADRLPVYASTNDSKPVSEKTTNGKTAFDQWFRTTEGVNQQIDTVTLPITRSGATWIYQSSSFFPIDDLGFGKEQGYDHNYHFTLELHFSFVYMGGEKFTFRGDDDLWLFVNNRLGLDLGGTHEIEEGTIDMDAQAAALGLVVGQTYTFDLFFAERNRSASNFRIETSIDCVMPAGLVI